MTTRHTDVVVVGDGPAGSALAHGCARRGVDTVLIGRGQPWAATYGCWVDDLEPAGDDLGRVADLFAVTMSDLAVVTDRRQILARSYGVLDNEAVRHRFLEGLDHHRERVERVGAAAGGHAGRVGRRFDDPVPARDRCHRMAVGARAARARRGTGLADRDRRGAPRAASR